ncbi:MAG: hypothetical protein H0V35_01575 [Nitrospira sp.]|nr:hypothetical protein [Nitrospira sp.]
MLKAGQGGGAGMGHSCWAKIRAAAWCMAGFCLIWYGASTAEAGSLYVYTDAQGQAVLTDNLQHVPVEYRGRVRAVASGESTSASVTTSAAEPAASSPSPASGVVRKLLSAVAQKVSSHPVRELTPHQTAVIIVAGACWMVLLLLIFLSSNPAIRLLSKCLLVLVGLAAVYHLATGSPMSASTVADFPQLGWGLPMENIVGQIKTKAEQSYRLQDERTTRQLDQAEPPAP